MSALRRALYLQAAVWAVAGAALALAPGFVTGTLFDGPPHQETAWIRLLGIQAFGLAMLVVLVAQRVEQLWWWSWAFALVAVGTASAAVLNAAFGLGPHQSAVWWWVFALAATALSVALLLGLALASREQPFPG